MNLHKNFHEIFGLTSWMELLVNTLEPLFGHMGITLGGGNIDMAQHDLDGPQIGPPFQQVAGKRVPE